MHLFVFIIFHTLNKNLNLEKQKKAKQTFQKVLSGWSEEMGEGSQPRSLDARPSTVYISGVSSMERTPKAMLLLAKSSQGGERNGALGHADV